jgi:hypothetical protein
MSDEIKSAYEKAMERVAGLKAPTPKQKLEWDGLPKGQKLAAEFLKGKDDPTAALNAHEQTVRPYVLKGAIEVLVANVALPRTPIAEKSVKRSVEGIRLLLGSKPQTKEIITRINYVLDQYKNHGEQQRQQVLQQLKQQFTMQLQQAAQQRGVQVPPNASVESMPEFQQEWLRVRAQLDQQYDEHLESFREAIKALVQV